MINLLLSNRKRMLMISLGIVYLWFGMLKFFPGISPAEGLAKETLTMLTFGLVPTTITYFILALWEVTIGIFLLLNMQIRFVIYLALLHILFTFTPLFLLPSLSFNEKIYSLTLVGQYIIKNLIIFSALLFVYPEKEKIAIV
ncbi:MAG: doxx family protein [Saprospiraceae bacterium]|uniref:Doxx family protein n=1 Tax=Candidatus Opimibacter skivensis TaxID=2982028 RepID=A0A9D7XT07_9BACT|nr:doxx family protein [Candidatus Opimibacter skivensis]